MAKLRFTERRIRDLSPGEKDRIVWDEAQTGLGLRIGRTGTKAFTFQRDFRGGKTLRMPIGKWPDWTVESARKRAREIIQMMDSGIDPRADERRAASLGITLGEAIKIHVARMRRKQARPRSIELLENEMDTHLSDLMRRPLADLDADLIRRRHLRMTEKRGKIGGPTVANRVVRHISAVYNSARRIHRELPAELPTVTVEPNKLRGKTEPIPFERLPAWRAAVGDFKSETRRDWLLCLLYTSLRRRDGASIKWSDIDLSSAILHRPNPKGGEDRAFEIPLPTQVLEIFSRRRTTSSCDLAFATRRRAPRNTMGPIVEFREKARPLPKGFDDWPSPHQLRATWATCAMAIGIDLLTIQAIMNHTVGSVAGVTGQYLSPSAESLRPAMQKVADSLDEKMRS